MKVERAKSDESDVSKTEARTRSVQSQTTSTAKATEAPNQGAFSKFLDEANQTNDRRSEKPSDDSASDTSVDKPGEGKHEGGVEAKKSRRDDQHSSSGKDDGDNNPAGTPPMPILDRASDTNLAMPPARAILHIADLERIVSSVRSDSFAGSKQVTIDLKNSVLDGVRIQLTMTEQGNLKAEFIALNDQIKKQLDARRTELESILKDRSIKCTEVKVSVMPREDRDRVDGNTDRDERSS